MTPFRRDLLVNVATALTALLLIGGTLRPSSWRSLPDFDKAYYPAGQKILTAPSTLYDAPVVDFVNIPIVALFFAPLAFLDAETARLAFAIVGNLSVLMTGALLVRLAGLDGWRRIAVFALFLVNGPLRYSFELGNATHLLLPLVLAILADARAGRETRAGALLALAAVVKIPLLVLALHFFLRHRWRALAAFGAGVAAVVGASILLFGLELHRVWFERCIRPFAAGPLGAYNVQSVDGFLARAIAGGRRHDWAPISVGPEFLLARYALLALLVGSVVWASSRPARPTDPRVEGLELSIVLCLALLVTPISWTHYYLFLLLPLAFYTGGGLAVPRGPLWLAALFAGTALVSLPVVEAGGRTSAALRPLMLATAYSPFFFGGTLLLGVFLAARWRAGGAS